MNLAIKRVTLYKHGLGFFERRGPFEGQTLRLEFSKRAMDDVLKSLIAIDEGAGQVLGLEFETPEDRNPNVARPTLALPDGRGLTELLNALRGREVRLEAGSESLEGLLVGVELEDKHHLERGLVTVFDAAQKRVSTLRLDRLERVTLLDETAVSDVSFALRVARSEEERASAVLQLSDDSHDLSISYIAPAPSWRVSYRLLSEELEADQRKLLLQAWGLFDNTLEDDLENVELTLVAGMPVSFRYALHQPNTPERPLVADQERTVGAPIEFDMMAAGAPMMEMEAAKPQLASMAAMPAPAPMGKAKARSRAQALEQSTQPVAQGADRGALFAYRVSTPVSVARGRSAMVPILSQRLEGKRELLYNRTKYARHPVASLRFKNQTGLTLERGPVTVLEGNDYAGEAVVDFSPAGAEVILAFAVELGIVVTERHEHETRLSSLHVNSGYLLFQEYNVQRTIYELVSALDRSADVVIEHPRSGGMEVFDSSEPLEQNATHVRWRVPCPAQQTVQFTVQERVLTSRHETVRSLDGDRLRVYLHDKFLDTQTVRGLEGVLALYRQADALKAQMDALQTERKGVYERQKQIQGNLAPLGRDGDEGRLRSRFVTELGKLEDRLSDLEREEKRLQSEIDQLEQLASQSLEKLG
jgi:hypothetical protein